MLGRELKKGSARRRFYSLTSEGRRVLARQRDTWKTFVHAMASSRVLTMPDWTEDLRQRLAPLRLSPGRESEIIEEPLATAVPARNVTRVDPIVALRTE